MSIVSDYIDEMVNFLTLANSSCEAFFTLAGKGNEKYAYIRKKFPTHIKLSEYSYLSTMITTLYMMLENDKKTINIEQLLKKIKHLKQFKPEKIKKIEDDIQQAKTIWSKIRILRCNQFAHYNYKKSITGVFKEANIKPEEFKQFILQMEKIINYISQTYNGSVHAFNLDTKHSTKQFMDSLTDKY